MQATVAPSLEVGRKLVDYCKKGQYVEAITELYADSIESIEAMEGGPDCPRVTSGKEAVLEKNRQFSECNEVHSSECEGPFPHGDRFALVMRMDCTPKKGPMAGNRMQMEEVCLYTVENDRIVKEEFFYHFDCGQ